MAMREVMGLSEFVEKMIAETKLEEQYKREDSDEARARVENIREFVGAVTEFEQKTENATLDAFLENIALVSDLDNAEMGGIMLQKDQHDRGERDHPQKLIAIPRTGGNVRSPVPGIDKAYGDK